MKKSILILSAAAGLAALLGISFGTGLAKLLDPTPDPVPLDEPALLHPIERIAYSTDWRVETERRAGLNQSAFVILRTGMNSCERISVSGAEAELFQMLLMDLSVPSGEDTEPGMFHEVLVPRSDQNCSSTRYVLIEWDVASDNPVTVEIGNTSLRVDMLLEPVVRDPLPFFIGLSVQSLLVAHCGEYCRREAELGTSYTQLLLRHGLQPIQSWVGAPPIFNNRLDVDHSAENGYSFRQTSISTAISGRVFFPRARLYQDPVAYLRALEETIHREGLVDRAWIYAADEPGDIEGLAEELKLYRLLAPSVRLMVTTPPDTRLIGLVDAYAPVINIVMNRDLVAQELRSDVELWTYASCMGSCGPNRRVHLDAEKAPGPDTDLPDFLIDRSAEQFSDFFREVEERQMHAALYYAATEGFSLTSDGVDLFSDPWNFGGNGDGLLVFPGLAGEHGLQTDQPLASLRLKFIRHELQEMTRRSDQEERSSHAFFFR